MPKRILTLVCWAMIAVLPLQVSAADAVGVLTGSGTVLVDGLAVSSNAVFAGEVIATKARSRAVVSAHGTTVTIGENSSIRFGSRDVELQSGAVVISTSDGMLRVDQVTVTATSGAPTKFLARKINGAVQVFALEGTVSVSDGQQTTPVPATRGVSIGGRGKRMSWLLNDDIGIVIVVAAAITAGVTLAIVNSQNAKPASSVGP